MEIFIYVHHASLHPQATLRKLMGIKQYSSITLGIITSKKKIPVSYKWINSGLN